MHCMIPSQVSLEWKRFDALPVQINTVSLSPTAVMGISLGSLIDALSPEPSSPPNMEHDVVVKHDNAIIAAQKPKTVERSILSVFFILKDMFVMNNVFTVAKIFILVKNSKFFEILFFQALLGNQ